MPVSTDFVPKILVLGAAFTLWPEPLATWIELEQVRLETAATLYEAAASIRGACVLLIRTDSLRRSDVPRLRLFDRFDVPRFFLPANENDVTIDGIGNWQDACRFFADLPQSLTGRKAVTPPLVERYDELAGQPLLSEQEMRALLGSPE